MAYAHFASETVQLGQVSGTLTNFPALFRRSAVGGGIQPDFRSVGNGGRVQNVNGYDLNLFADAAGAPSSTLLASDHQFYNPATGAVICWAKVPALAVGTK